MPIYFSRLVVYLDQGGTYNITDLYETIVISYTALFPQWHRNRRTFKVITSYEHERVC